MALAGCSDRREHTPVVNDTVTSSIEIARADSSAMPRDTTALAQPGNRAPAPPRRPPRKARPPTRAPSVQRDTAPSVQLDSSPAVQPYTAPQPEPDTAAALRADSAPAPAPNGTTPADTSSAATTGAAPAVDTARSVISTSPTAAALPQGTEIHAALDDAINSRRDSAGKVLTAKVMETMRSPDGRIVLPAGSVVQLTVTQLEPAKSRSASDGKLALRVDGVTARGGLQEIHAEIQRIPHELRGRGVTAGEAEKVGVGAAAGAVAGRVIGGNTRGAVIGGVVGAAGGAAVAAQTASRDVVVRSGTPVVLVLTAPLLASGPR
jgi:hypothetical protein